jgi:hypothetical protein
MGLSLAVNPLKSNRTVLHGSNLTWRYRGQYHFIEKKGKGPEGRWDLSQWT